MLQIILRSKMCGFYVPLGDLGRCNIGCKLFDHFVRAREHRRRNSNA